MDPRVPRRCRDWAKLTWLCGITARQRKLLESGRTESAARRGLVWRGNYGPLVGGATTEQGRARRAIRGPTGAARRAKDLLDRALQALTLAIELDPSPRGTHLILAESFSEAGRLVDAIPEFEAAIKQDSKSEAACLGLATAYWRQRQFQTPFPIKAGIDLVAKDPEANAMLADILEHDGQRAAASRHAGWRGRKPGLTSGPRGSGPRLPGGKTAKAGHSRVAASPGADPDGSYHFLLFRAYKQAGDEDPPAPRWRSSNACGTKTPSHECRGAVSRSVSRRCSR